MLKKYCIDCEHHRSTEGVARDVCGLELTGASPILDVRPLSTLTEAELPLLTACDKQRSIDGHCGPHGHWYQRDMTKIEDRLPAGELKIGRDLDAEPPPAEEIEIAGAGTVSVTPAEETEKPDPAAGMRSPRIAPESRRTPPGGTSIFN